MLKTLVMTVGIALTSTAMAGPQEVALCEKLPEVVMKMIYLQENGKHQEIKEVLETAPEDTKIMLYSMAAAAAGIPEHRRAMAIRHVCIGVFVKEGTY